MQISAHAASNAYAATMQSAATGDDGVSDGISQSATGSDFGSVLSQAVSGAIQSGHSAESLAAQGISGGGDMTQIVTAVSQAQLALQTTTVVRDRMVQAYQDVMRMSI
ncbi:flagellar hook-basal body complex protein FliE [Tanticharoenia sakaeratensis]|jgi:flagellar hook-basal body complex protein FliE|uniref:Flagellar hook-basal body complex protein FliE n=1 Tax=Tanticharoenia sakaeratensis NBRC 103193 TaxID=1231623 RepID=A0A0D6MQ26_9PROT|nr:flagellar hook-basal body complex protein FliE [Tanticharoenia sakaeratensis]GAN55792.1 flagellar hook-basal body protein FleE [Tanticharoenia sakaeratensis NBRC 103193]GBQ21596.1 flagellar hook-basal body protein FleE [Tanticharoenia sakaeratensis NBRC 103193]